MWIKRCGEGEQTPVWRKQVETVALGSVSRFTLSFKRCSLKERRLAEFMWTPDSKIVPVPGRLSSGHLILNQGLF